MALSSGPVAGLAGDLHPFQNHCSLRDVESTVTGLSNLMMNNLLAGLKKKGGGGGKNEVKGGQKETS